MRLYEIFETGKKQKARPDPQTMKDKSNSCRSYGQEGFCFLSVSYFVRILSKFQAVRGFR